MAADLPSNLATGITEATTVSILAQQSTIEAAPYSAFLFFAFAGLTVISAWCIVLSQNIVRMAVYLLLTLAGAAGLYFMMEAEFLAAVQLIVYAGGTLILIIFGVMLTSKNPFLQLKPTMPEVFLGVGLALLISSMLIFALVNTTLGQHTGLIEDAGYSEIRNIGIALLTKYLVPFELAAVLLLAVMIGAAYMARRRSVGEVGNED